MEDLAGAERRQCEFSLIRYVPDPVKNEFVNIGVLLREQSAPERMELRFTRDWTRVRCIDPQADIAMLEALEMEVRQRIVDSPSLLQLLRDTLSNTVQMTEPKGCLAETFMTQVEQLMRLYVEGHKLPREQKRTGRSAILGEMRKQFEREGVWDLMRKRIAASKYTRAGDPLLIDCGYRTNGTMKMFQAVSLEKDVDAAVRFAFASPFLLKQVKVLENADLELTAIVEPIRDIDAAQEEQEQYAFGRDTMKDHGIRIFTTNEISRLASTARVELRV